MDQGDAECRRGSRRYPRYRVDTEPPEPERPLVLDITAAISPRQRSLLKWVGLQQPAPAPAEWVPLVQNLSITDTRTGTSRVGDRLVKLLGEAGIPAQQRSYDAVCWTDTDAGWGPGTLMFGTVRLAVLVQSRDHTKAVTVAQELAKAMADAKGEPVSAEELERMALDTGP
jgi:hypothetical protein